MANILLPSNVFQDDAGPLLPIWLLAIIAIVLIVVFVWLVVRWQREAQILRRRIAAPTHDRMDDLVMQSEGMSSAPQKTEAMPSAEMLQPQTAPVMNAFDDLKIIEGIGPKIGKVLNEAGVTTFAQLADLTPDRITEILQTGGIRLADPRSWPEQARLAANGDQTALTLMQTRLKGGRIV